MMTDEKELENQQLAMSTEEYDFESNLRLDIFIIDSGWDSVAHRVLNNSMDLLKNYLKKHNLYVLSPEQSMQVLMAHSDLIGRDPILMVVDRLAAKLNNPHGFGARLILGHIHDEHRVDWLIKMFVKIVNTHFEALDIAYTFQQYNHKIGVKGAIDIIMESFA